MRKLILISFPIVLLLACETPKTSEFNALSKRADALKNGQPSEKERIRNDFDDWAKKYGVTPAEQRGPKLVNNPDECDWFARLDQNGKSGSCFRKRVELHIENGAGKLACSYDCYYP